MDLQEESTTNSLKKKKTNKVIFQKSEEDILNTTRNEVFKHQFLDFLAKMHNLLRGCAVSSD